MISLDGIALIPFLLYMSYVVVKALIEVSADDDEQSLHQETQQP